MNILLGLHQLVAERKVATFLHAGKSILINSCGNDPMAHKVLTFGFAIRSIDTPWVDEKVHLFNPIVFACTTSIKHVLQRWKRTRAWTWGILQE